MFLAGPCVITPRARLVLADVGLLQSNGSKSHGPTGPSSHLVSRYLALAAATSLGLTSDTRLPSSQCLGQELGGGHLTWANPVWSIRRSPTCLSARIAHRASPKSSRPTLGDDCDTRRQNSRCVLQELERVGEVVGCRMLCFSTPDDLESCGVAVPSRRSQRRLSGGSRPEKDCWRRCVAAATSLGPTLSGLSVVLLRASRHVSRIGRHQSRLVRRSVMIVTLAVRTQSQVEGASVDSLVGVALRRTAGGGAALAFSAEAQTIASRSIALSAGSHGVVSRRPRSSICVRQRSGSDPLNLTLRRLYPLVTTPGPECPGKRPEPNEIDY
ncbi:hypothetical protein THAOC_15823 [Thalassiosira oceanica]|uniref:Uncharacterized protein n=1 Tax=Thalassiosira oceanica TaxID=159749 RepID=K0SEU4_THAOC|nr:hypothetical protein THAOC_15823 [Thalassiosira oceanica]|eukprot:EJK63514.1 hypothetical protein THAOC_15823 [Thalassiosira oceanica]